MVISLKVIHVQREIEYQITKLPIVCARRRTYPNFCGHDSMYGSITSVYHLEQAGHRCRSKISVSKSRIHVGRQAQTRECLKSALLLKAALYCSRLLMSLTQSSSFPGPTPSDFRSCISSLMEDRLIHGIGYRDAWTRTDSPGFKTLEDWPSMETPEGDRLLSPT